MTDNASKIPVTAFELDPVTSYAHAIAKVIRTISKHLVIDCNTHTVLVDEIVTWCKNMVAINNNQSNCGFDVIVALQNMLIQKFPFIDQYYEVQQLHINNPKIIQLLEKNYNHGILFLRTNHKQLTEFTDFVSNPENKRNVFPEWTDVTVPEDDSQVYENSLTILEVSASHNTFHYLKCVTAEGKEILISMKSLQQLHGYSFSVILFTPKSLTKMADEKKARKQAKRLIELQRDEKEMKSRNVQRKEPLPSQKANPRQKKVVAALRHSGETPVKSCDMSLVFIGIVAAVAVATIVLSRNR
jgi:hypothetical protein